MDFNYPRTARLINESVSALELNLSGLSVYTEAATGGFAATAATAIAAGADTVYALARNSSYGTVAEARSHTERLTSYVGDEERLVFPDRKRQTHVEAADIITNTGFVRPIDEQMIDWISNDSAVPLMYEPWEFRAEDMDIDMLWTKGIPVLGTDESDHRVATQQYLRSLAVKVTLECDLEVHQGTFVVVGDGRMAEYAAIGLEALDASVTRIGLSDCEESKSIPAKLTNDVLDQLDAVLVVDHKTDRLLVGDGGLIETSKLAERAPGATVIHICGPIAAEDIDAVGLRYAPANPAVAKSMSYTTGYLGPRPIVELHAAGLRVGADLTRTCRNGADWRTATATVAETPLALDFEESFKRDHGFYD